MKRFILSLVLVATIVFASSSSNEANATFVKYCGAWTYQGDMHDENGNYLGTDYSRVCHEYNADGSVSTDVEWVRVNEE
jgi:hypothetical protein